MPLICGEFWPTISSIFSVTAPIGHSTRIVPSHVPSNPLSKAKLSRCLRSGVCIIATPARLPEAPPEPFHCRLAVAFRFLRSLPVLCVMIQPSGFRRDHGHSEATAFALAAMASATQLRRAISWAATSFCYPQVMARLAFLSPPPSQCQRVRSNTTPGASNLWRSSHQPLVVRMIHDT